MQRLILKHLKADIHFSYVQVFISSIKGNEVVPIIKARRLCLGNLWYLL
jgi:hypothetical protein